MIAAGDAVLASAQADHDWGGERLDVQAWAIFRSSGLSFLANTFGDTHPYYTEFAARTSSISSMGAEIGRGILTAARDEVAGGWAVTARGLVSAEVFADFLEMAKYLLDEGFKNAAAVITGSTLDEHLRQLARKHAIPLDVVVNGRTVSKKADVINADLVKAGAYGVLAQKTVTASLDVRNRAAHGQYGEYAPENVVLMWQGVAQFMAQYPV